MKENHVFNYLLLLGIGILWGSQFMFNDIAIRSMSPEAIATFRLSIGAIALTILVLLFERKTIAKTPKIPLTKSLMLRYVALAIFEGIIPFFCVAWGQEKVDSSVAAILLGTIPIFTGLLVALFVKSEKHNLGSILSIIVGFIGLLILLGPSLLNANLAHLTYELAILIGAVSFAIALILIKTMPAVPPMRMTRNVLIIAAVPLIVYLAITNPHVFSTMTTHAWFAVTTLGVFCSGIVYVLYVKLIKSSGAGFASLSNYLVPLFGTIFGVFLMNDHIQWTTIVALVVILGSLVIHKLPFGRATY